MEREIKVRKKRFAAFWSLALTLAILILPVTAEETPSAGTTESTTTTETTDSTVTTETTDSTQNTESINTTEMAFASGGEAETIAYIGDLDGSTVSAGTIIGHFSEFEIQYFDYDGSQLSGVQTIAYEESHTVSSYSGKAPASCFQGWKLAVVEVSGQKTRANLTAQMDPYPIGSGEHTLTSGNAYILNGVTKVAGDPSTYVSGSTVYGSGTYTFS